MTLDLVEFFNFSGPKRTPRSQIKIGFSLRTLAEKLKILKNSIKVHSFLSDFVWFRQIACGRFADFKSTRISGFFQFWKTEKLWFLKITPEPFDFLSIFDLYLPQKTKLFSEKKVKSPDVRRWG